MRDHIHSVIVSYNRQELTAQTISSYLDTVTLPYTLVVVDNGSERETTDWLADVAWANDFDVVFLGENKYPGFATNRGWERMPAKTSLLHRSDNDFLFLQGWCEEVLRVFSRRVVGQVGLRTDEEEGRNPYNVGGNNVVRRRLWDLGLRYDERAWGDGYDPGWTEDSLLSPAVTRFGYVWTRVERPCIEPLSREDPRDPYYRESWRVRGIRPPA